MRKQFPFDFAQGRLSCLRCARRRNDKVVGVVWQKSQVRGGSGIPPFKERKVGHPRPGGGYGTRGHELHICHQPSAVEEKFSEFAVMARGTGSFDCVRLRLTSLRMTGGSGEQPIPPAFAALGVGMTRLWG